MIKPLVRASAFLFFIFAIFLNIHTPNVYAITGSEPDLIKFEYKAVCPGTRTTECTYFLELDTKEIESCKERIDPQKCVGDVIVSLCKPLFDLGDRYKYQNYLSECYGYFAQKLKNPDLCELAEKQSGHCYSSLARELEDESICEKIKPAEKGEHPERDYCYSSIALKKNEPSMCEMAGSVMAHCYAQIATANVDEEICKLPKKFFIRKACVKEYLYKYYFKQNFSPSQLLYGIKSCIHDNPSLKTSCVLEYPLIELADLMFFTIGSFILFGMFLEIILFTLAAIIFSLFKERKILKGIIIFFCFILFLSFLQELYFLLVSGEKFSTESLTYILFSPIGKIYTLFFWLIAILLLSFVLPSPLNIALPLAFIITLIIGLTVIHFLAKKYSITRILSGLIIIWISTVLLFLAF